MFEFRSKIQGKNSSCREFKKACVCSGRMAATISESCMNRTMPYKALPSDPVTKYGMSSSSRVLVTNRVTSRGSFCIYWVTVDPPCKLCPQHKICKPASQIGFARSWMLFPKAFQGQQASGGIQLRHHVHLLSGACLSPQLNL